MPHMICLEVIFMLRVHLVMLGLLALCCALLTCCRRLCTFEFHFIWLSLWDALSLNADIWLCTQCMQVFNTRSQSNQLQSHYVP